MSNIRVDWKDPVVRADGSSLSAAEIARVDVAMRSGGAPDFTLVGSVAPGVQSFTQTDLPPGDYEFQLTVVDTQSPPRSSASVAVAVNIPVPVKAEPGPVTDVVATVF